MPDIIQLLKDATASKEYAKILYTLLPELFQAADEGKIIGLPCKPHTFIWTISEDGEIISNYKLLGATTQYGKIVYIIYRGEACGEYLLASEIYLSHEAAEAALKGREKE